MAHLSLLLWSAGGVEFPNGDTGGAVNDWDKVVIADDGVCEKK
jgi:hypothetical protein